MPTPSSRTPVKIARGSYSDLNGSISDLQEGEIVYAQDQDACYVKEGSSLVKVKGDVADAQITTAKIADDAVTADKLANSINTEIAANTAKTTNATHTGEVTGATALTIADNIVDEANLKVDNSPTDDYVLTAKSSASGGLTWAAASGGGGGGGGGLSSDSERNTVGGSNAGDSFTGTDATDNTLIGYDAGTDITTADYNSFYGSYAGENCTTGSSNCAYGFESGEALTTGQKNVFIGHEAARSSTLNQNCVAIGYQALRDNVDGNDASWEGIVAVGMEAGRSSTGYNNTYLGYKAGQSTGSAYYQVFIGDETGSNNQGIGCIGIGRMALKNWNSGNGLSTVGQYNIGIGPSAGAGTNPTGEFNVMIGNSSMYKRTSGSSNCALGSEAGKEITTGNDNCLIGYHAGKSGTNDLTTGSNNTLIGHDAAASSGTVSNEITLGDSNISSLRCQVQTISSLSDERDKTQIEELPAGLDFVSQLKPVKFKWNPRQKGLSCQGKVEAGFIAQQLQTAQKENDADYLGLVYDNNPDRLEASYGKLVPVLVKAIQELKMEIETLKNNG